MAVPDYQTLMAPVLRALADGAEQPISQLRGIIAKQIGLTDEDLKATLPSGSRLFVNRLHWTITYLYQAGLVRRPRRAVVQITSRGQAVLAEHPDRVDNSILLQFKEFTEFQSRARGDASPAQASAQEPAAAAETTPVETIATAVAEANSAVAAEVLERVREREPVFLEQLVLNVLTALGYRGAAGSAERLGRSGDNRLDGVIRQDPLGLDQIYVQAKRYAAGHTVGRPEIQGFVGALHGAQANRGVFITTSSFTNEATTYADRVAARVILIDGITLAQLMVAHNIGVQDRETTSSSVWTKTSSKKHKATVLSSSLQHCLGRVHRAKAKPHAVASRALTRRPRPERRQLSRRTGEDKDTTISACRTAVRRAISPKFP